RRLSPRDVRVRVHDRYRSERADVLDLPVGLPQGPAHHARRRNRPRLQLVAGAQPELQHRARVRRDAIAGERRRVRLYDGGTKHETREYRVRVLEVGSLKAENRRYAAAWSSSFSASRDRA